MSTYIEERPARATTSRDTLAKLAAATPDSRDRYVDFLRAFSIGVVVLGHWLISVISWRGGDIRGENALDLVPLLWLATWVFQVMPIFFFVGGFSNLVSLQSVLRRGGSARLFRRSRLNRLMRPTAVFIGAWVVIALSFEYLPGAPPNVRHLAILLAVGPLWFLGVYTLMVLLTPQMVRLHTRYRLGALAGLAGLGVAVDVLRLGFGHALIGLANVLFVWLFVHQLGFFYADGTFDRQPRRLFWLMAAVGLAGLVVLTSLGIYPGSMVGRPGDEVSNMNPPTIPIMALAIWQVGLAMLLRGPVNRWLQGARVWQVVIGANAMVMTMFLWHLTAMLLTVLILYPAGFPQPQPAGWQWWLLRPVWIGALAVILAFFVSVFGRFERPRLRAPADRYWNFQDFYTL
jgi:hypothetical protein